MYSATTMLAKARGNIILPDNKRLYYRNVYLQSDHWKSLRKEKLDETNYCERCKTTFSLDIHHINYKGLYDVKLKDLQVLCRICHDKEHKRKDKKLKRNNKNFHLIRKNRRIKEIFNNELREINNDFRYILNRKCPNLQLICWLLKSILLLKEQESPAQFSPKNKERHLKFNKTVNYKQKCMNNYVSIHY